MVFPRSRERRTPPMETFHSRRAPVYACHGMVASSQPLAAQIGLQILKEGGNAVDAAIAMAAVSNVTEPMMNGLGGDAFVMVFWRGKLHGLNASGRAGRAMTAEALRKDGLGADASSRLGKRLGARRARRLFCVARTLRLEKLRRPGGTRCGLRGGGCRCQPESRAILEVGSVETTTLERVDARVPPRRAAT